MTITETEGPNVDLFIDVLAQIERHPETWDQGYWRNTAADCGTAYCFAGWACHLNGVQWVGVEEFVRPAFGVSASDVWEGEPVAAVEEMALSLLGIGIGDAGLFDADRTLDDLYRISADLLGLDEQVLRAKVRDVVADGAVQS